MTKRIEPTKGQVRSWVESFVPGKDLFFVEEKDLEILKYHLSSVLVVPKEEFLKHSSYKQIEMSNSYMYWNISIKAEFIIVAQPSWIRRLPESMKRDILTIQHQMGRGLIFPLSLFSCANLLPEEYIVEGDGENVFVIQAYIWSELPFQVKRDAIQAYAQLWDSWTCFEVPQKTPAHIKEYANKFSTVSGSNCLSATLFAITEQEWIIHEWVHPHTFVIGLKKANYFLTNEEVMEGDVITWSGNDGVIQHATYHLGDNLFFNKNGQTFFNPWKITHFEQLNEEWGQYKMNVYRRKLSKLPSSKYS